MLVPMEKPSFERPNNPRADASALCTVSPSLSEPSPDDEHDQLGSSSGGTPKLDPRLSRVGCSLVRLAAGVGAFRDEPEEVWLVFRVAGI